MDFKGGVWFWLFLATSGDGEGRVIYHFFENLQHFVLEDDQFTTEDSVVWGEFNQHRVESCLLEPSIGSQSSHAQLLNKHDFASEPFEQIVLKHIILVTLRGKHRVRSLRRLFLQTLSLDARLLIHAVHSHVHFRGINERELTTEHLVT